MTPVCVLLYKGNMRVVTRVLQAKTVDWLRSALLGGLLTRSGIARELCEREN